MRNKKENKKNNVTNLDSICKHISERERLSAKAERESIKYMQCIYLSDHIGKIYTGIVGSVTEYGLFVNIPDNGCDAFVRLTNIDGTWQANMESYCIKEYNTGEIIRLGDEVSLIISKVDIDKKNIDASLIRL